MKWRKSRSVKPLAKIMVCGWSDFFHEASDPWRADAWHIMRMLDEYVFVITTKRSERIAECLPPDWGGGYPNVWLGVSVGHPCALQRIADLHRIPAAVRFLSIEPLIASIQFTPAMLRGIHWAIIGGESGLDARPMDPVWAHQARISLLVAGVPTYFKQWGVWADPITAALNIPTPTSAIAHTFPSGSTVYRLGLKNTGHLINGEELLEYPQAYAIMRENFKKRSRW
jgi:protein gp37